MSWRLVGWGEQLQPLMREGERRMGRRWEEPSVTVTPSGGECGGVGGINSCWGFWRGPRGADQRLWDWSLEICDHVSFSAPTWELGRRLSGVPWVSELRRVTLGPLALGMEGMGLAGGEAVGAPPEVLDT